MAKLVKNVPPQESDEEIDRIVAEFNAEMKRKGRLLEDPSEDEAEMTVVMGGTKTPIRSCKTG